MERPIIVRSIRAIVGPIPLPVFPSTYQTTNNQNAARAPAETLEAKQPMGAVRSRNQALRSVFLGQQRPSLRPWSGAAVGGSAQAAVAPSANSPFGRKR